MNNMVMQAVNYKTEWYNTKPNYKEFNDFLPEYWQMKYLDRWTKIIELLPQDKMIDAKVLDIGCGMGRACSYFNSFGAKCIGIEPSEYASKIAKERGIHVINEYFDNFETNLKFDVIHCEQVLSHIPDALATVKKAYNLLEDGGVLVIEEPNDYNPLQLKLQKEYGEYWITSDHVNYFNFDSMKELLNKAGFDFTYKTCTYPMELFALMGFKYIGHDNVGRGVHKMRYDMLKGMGTDLRLSLLENFAKQGLGRDLVVYAKKGGYDRDKHGYIPSAISEQVRN